MATIYDIPVTDIMGLETTLIGYQGQVLLIVNTASKCGFTPQYQTLQQIHERFAGRGFAVLGFPANDFLRQEPGTNAEIRQFCTVNYGVTFPLFAKVAVSGKEMHPLYRFLTSKETNPQFGGRITWNFNKFLVDRQGKVVGRFDSREKPDSPAVIAEIEAALAQK